MSTRKLGNRFEVASLVLAMAALAPAVGQAQPSPDKIADRSSQAQEVVELSNQKWRWMAVRDVTALDKLFDNKSVFVHMGGTMSKAQELEVIRSGAIQYKQADIQDVSVRIIDATAIVLSRIRLTAIVGGNEVINPFVVTEVYVKQDDEWKLGSMSFTRLLGE